MALRLIARSTQVQVHGYIHQARVYRDAEWNEYRVRIYLNGQLNAAADYHTSDKQDAHDTMQAYETNWLKAATKPGDIRSEIAALKNAVTQALATGDTDAAMRAIEELNAASEEAGARGIGEAIVYSLDHFQPADMDNHARAVTLNAQANARGWHNTATGEMAVAESETDSGIAKAWRDSAKNAQHWSAYWSALALSHLASE